MYLAPLRDGASGLIRNSMPVPRKSQTLASKSTTNSYKSTSKQNLEHVEIKPIPSCGTRIVNSARYMRQLWWPHCIGARRLRQPAPMAHTWIMMSCRASSSSARVAYSCPSEVVLVCPRIGCNFG